MNQMHAIAVILGLALVLGGCDSSSGTDLDSGTPSRDLPDTQRPQDNGMPPGDGLSLEETPSGYEVPNPGGKGHGEPCTEDRECQFLRCIAAPTVTGGRFRICTKDCASGPLAPCNLEGPGYLCLRTSPSAGNDLVSFCTLACGSASECPEEYGDCRIVVGAQKTCTVPEGS